MQSHQGLSFLPTGTILVLGLVLTWRSKKPSFSFRFKGFPHFGFPDPHFAQCVCLLSAC